MGVVLNTNSASIKTSRILQGNRVDMERAMERLASGKRINAAADDAAGLAVAAKVRADIRSLDQAVRNANDAVSLINTYDGAAAEIESMLVRMRELAVQMANGTYEDDDRDQAEFEFGFLVDEIDRIAENTLFNQNTLADGSGSFKFQIGPVKTLDQLEVNLDGLTASDLGIDASKIDGLTDIETSLDDIDGALSKLATARAEAGSYSNRLGYTINNLMSVSQRQKEALSGIEDADYAAESANLARGMVLAQAGTAMLAQSNTLPQYVLALLRT